MLIIYSSLLVIANSRSRGRPYSTETTTPDDAEVGYVSNPKETIAVRKRVEEELLLKAVTKTSLSHRRPEGKVPYEHSFPSTTTTNTNTEIRHPSGFVVPSPSSSSPIAYASYADTRVRPADLLRTGFADNVSRFADLQLHARSEMEVKTEKVPQEVLTRDGGVAHPSGFVPPSPQMPAMEEVKEHYKPAMRVVRDEMTLVGAGAAREAS